MALSDYQAESRVIQLKGNSFSVEGLSLESFATLIHTHLSDIEALFDLGQQVMGGKAELDDSDFENLAIQLVKEAPGLVANIIALAAGEATDQGVASARKLTFPIQLQTLLAISELTFSEVGGIKKALEIVANLLKTDKKAAIRPT